MERLPHTKSLGHMQQNGENIELDTPHSRKLTFPDVISRDTGIEVTELPTAMEDRDCWREIVLGISPKGAR